MQAIGTSSTLSRLVRFPAKLAAAHRVLTRVDGTTPCFASYHSHLKNSNVLTRPAQSAHQWGDDRCPSLVHSFLDPALNVPLHSTFSSKAHRSKSGKLGSIRGAVYSRPKPSTKPGSKPGPRQSPKSSRPSTNPGSRPNPGSNDEESTPSSGPAPWLAAREEIKRQVNNEKKARKLEAAQASANEVDMFGVPLRDSLSEEGSMKVGDYQARNLRLRSAEFVISSTDVSKCPDTDLPEFAVVGRSNVGKSSLVNMLTNRKSLAMTSKKPGKTQTINHFLINDDWYLVDLPGYGFAAAPGKARSAWHEFTKDYFLNRKQLVTVLLLVDASIPPQPIDLECAEWLGENQVPVTLVFTKCDKRKKVKAGGKHMTENIADFERVLSESWDEPPTKILTSSVSGMGRHELLSHLSQLRSFWKDK